VKRALVDRLRHALLASRKLRLFHRHEGGAERRQHTVSPLGFLYGARHYLVAWSHQYRKPVLFRLSRIERAELLEESCDVPEGFDLRAFAEQSFGVFQEEPVDVVWRFRPAAAAEAREYVFHPRQETETLPDGSLLVRFRAGGLREMAWHLFSWGGDVEVLAPAALRAELDRWLAASLGAARTRVRRVQRVRRSALRKRG
jgi:predicted DNA-binding transcriptional regulator YafY